MVFFIQGRRLETLVQDPGGDTLFCPLKTIPGGYVVTPQSPPGDTKGERLSQLGSWSCPPLHRKTPLGDGSLPGPPSEHRAGHCQCFTAPRWQLHLLSQVPDLLHRETLQDC